RETLHAPQEAFVLPALREDLRDVRPLERLALRPGAHHLGHVLPALVLLERLDLAVQAEEVVGEVGIDAEALDRHAEGIAARLQRLDQPLAGDAALAEPERRLAHALTDARRRTE